MSPLSCICERRLSKALEALLINPDLGVREAARQFRIPRQTIPKFKNRGGIERLPRERKPMVSAGAEKRLVEMLAAQALRGVPVTERHLVEGVRVLLNSM